jgi:hypothetical protein
MAKGRQRKFSKANLKEKHGETCMCRRCRARDFSIELRPIRLKAVSIKDFLRDDEPET